MQTKYYAGAKITRRKKIQNLSVVFFIYYNERH